MIQKMQKTVEILQVQHIDKVIEVPQAQLIDEAVEVPEIMQRHDPMIQEVEDAQRLGKQSRSAAQVAAQTQAALNEKNSTDKFTRVIRRTQLRALRRDSSQSDVHECETSVRRSAKLQKDPNVSPQASQAPSAKTRLARKSHERQPPERESSVAPADA